MLQMVRALLIHGKLREIFYELFIEIYIYTLRTTVRRQNYIFCSKILSAVII